MVTEFNVVIDNDGLVQNEDLLPILFSPNDDIERIPSSFSMIDLLVHLKFFPSKSQARRNWNRTGFDIPKGFTSIVKIGKLNKQLHIWNPIEQSA